ncbi:MAG: sigma-54-dependent Fis family transcriptional regulator [Deltaproteobacteria bacterium]|nr:sigma-54-dependent Fis family transcriptional regulator [Deltaproteobacteria bacterium]MBI3293474.1 sigma-54-dependent Fis family transcriptional regulator [Deltaproteobacteria bacterium]
MNVARILIVDDEESIREFFEIMLKREGYQVLTAGNGVEALEILKKQSADLIISDIQMPEMSGLELLSKVKEMDPEAVQIMITAFGSTETAVEAMKLGAYDYVSKPFKIDEVKIIIRQALEKRDLKLENAQLKKELGTKYAFDNIIGGAPPMMRIYEMVKRVANTKSSVLITGESGTGKELIARAIHYNGPLKDRPFVTVNCGAIPENLMESEMFGHKKGSFTGAIADKKGLFEVANGGTIFLDELGELPLTMQVKLLRVIQEGTFKRVGSTEDITVDVRVVSATNRNLENDVKTGKFREDLFYRLNVIQIHCPPLRERKEDIQMLANHFLEKFSKSLGVNVKKISETAMEILKGYHFPGNVRELENIVERTVALEPGPAILPESWPRHLADHSPQTSDRLDAHNIEIDQEKGINLEALVADFERALLTKALERTSGVKKKAARLLNISFRSMRYRVDKFGLGALSVDDDEDDVIESAAIRNN